MRACASLIYVVAGLTRAPTLHLSLVRQGRRWMAWWTLWALPELPSRRLRHLREVSVRSPVYLPVGTALTRFHHSNESSEAINGITMDGGCMLHRPNGCWSLF